MLRSWTTVVVLAGGVIACLLIGAAFPAESPIREAIKIVAGILTFLAVGLGGWLAVNRRPSE